MSDIKREALLKTLSLVRPALATGDHLPALRHIRFDGKYATAYNDISAISVRVDLDVKRCLPGEMLIQAMRSFNAETVALLQSDKEVKLSSGRSNVKLPTLDADAFPLKWPQDDCQEIELEPTILKGIERCLMAVGNDPTHPETLGVTLDATDGQATLYATDAFSISRYETDVKIKLPGGAPVILPTFFCEQLVSLGRSFNEEEIVLAIFPGAITAEFGNKAKLFNRTLVDKDPLDFPGMFRKELKLKDVKKELVPIPDAFDAALSRALLVLQQEADKVTKFETQKSGFLMNSSSSMGDSDDTMKTEDDPRFDCEDVVHLDPALVARGAKACALMGFLKGSLALADATGRFVHLVAYCSSK